MKRIFLLVALLASICSNAQMVTITEAPATDILLGEQIADGLKSLQVSMDNYELVKSNVEKVEKVNSYIGQLQLISDMIDRQQDRKSTRLNSSHVRISYAVFCLKKKK